jgi:hypothetical protein
VFREAVRVPRHAFSPNCTGASGTPLDFFKEHFGFVLVPGRKEIYHEMGAKYRAQIHITLGSDNLQPLSQIMHPSS